MGSNVVIWAGLSQIFTADKSMEKASGPFSSIYAVAYSLFLLARLSVPFELLYGPRTAVFRFTARNISKMDNTICQPPVAKPHSASSNIRIHV